MIALQEETESIEEGKFAPRDDPSRLSVNEKVNFCYLIIHVKSFMYIISMHMSSQCLFPIS